MARAMKAYKGLGMEGLVARWYDKMTRRDMPEFAALATRITKRLPPSATVLEIAPGPGFLAIELAKRGLDVIGVDISRTFVEIAQRNAAAAGVMPRFKLGDAAALPIADGSVDFVICRAAFKNFFRPILALAEMRRVLRMGGAALLVDLRRDVSIAAIKRYTQGLGVGRLNRWFMILVFRTSLIPRAYSLDEIRRMASEAGWSQPQIQITPVGFEASMSKETMSG
jgi:ubiquinone/menaquinone biosynthesis C-methylase UbiE